MGLQIYEITCFSKIELDLSYLQIVTQDHKSCHQTRAVVENNAEVSPIRCYDVYFQNAGESVSSTPLLTVRIMKSGLVDEGKKSVGWHFR